MSAPLMRRLVIATATIAFVVIALFIASRIPRTLTIFLIAAFIAFGAAPIVRRLETRMPRIVGIAIVYVSLLGGLVLLVVVIVPITSAQVFAIAAHTNDYVSASQAAVAHVQGFVRDRLGTRFAMPAFDGLQAEVGSRVSTALNVTLASVASLVLWTITALFVGTSALILSVFFLARGHTVRRGVLQLLPASRRPKADAILTEIASIFGHFVAGQVALSAIVGVAVWIALAPAHFTFALLVAVLCGLGYAVPFVGLIVAQVLAGLLALPQGNGMLVYVTVAIFVIARIADSVLVPKIMGDSVGVSPIAVMFAVFAGGELFGVAGLVLAIPAAALVRVLYTYFMLPWLVGMQLADAGLSLDVPDPLVDADRAAVEEAVV